MSTPEVLTRDQMRVLYGHFYEHGPKLELDRARIPEQFWRLIPYAEFWGAADDSLRGRLLQDVPHEVLQNLKLVVTTFDDDLEKWLIGPEADASNPSDEYIAFCAMIMAADCVDP